MKKAVKIKLNAILKIVTATTGRKLIISAVGAALAAVGVHEIDPTLVDTAVTVIAAIVQIFV